MKLKAQKRLHFCKHFIIVSCDSCFNMNDSVFICHSALCRLKEHTFQIGAIMFRLSVFEGSWRFICFILGISADPGEICVVRVKMIWQYIQFYSQKGLSTFYF